MMSLFLEHVSTTFAKYFIVMQVDPRELACDQRAHDSGKYPTHCSACLQSRARVLVEHVWEELREKKLSNLALPSLDDVIDKVCEGLNQLEADPEHLRSLTYFPHFRMVS